MYQKRNKELAILALYLGDYGKRFYLRQIGRLARLPLKTTQNVIVRLLKDKILKGTVEGRNKYFKLNLDNAQTKFYLLQAEIYKTNLFLEKYPQFKIFLKDLKTPATLIIFGSFAKFAAGKASDLDLLIISKSGQLPLHLLPYETQRIELTEKAFLNALRTGEPLIKEALENHIILNNHSFFINTLWDYYARQT